ncbi:MAG: class I SAM-dependent methyltransferase, partial [Myxococcota bacterium]
MIEYTTCPSCECDRAEDLVPPGRSVDTTLDLIYSRNRAAEFSHVDLSAFLDPQFVICQNCALIFVRMRSTPAAAREYYGQLFHVIEAPLPFDTLPLPARFIVRRTKIAREMVATLVQNGVVNSKSTVLWARCNAGEGLKVLGDEHGLTELYGLEYLPSLIRHAKEVYGLENVEPLFTPEFENPFPREKYDVIFCNETFGHAHEPREIARYLKTLLSEGGVLVSYNEKDHLKILNDKKLFPYGMNFFHKQV